MKRLLGLILAFTVLFGLFYAGSKPIAVNLLHEPWDKIAHYIVFSVLTAALWVTSAGRWPIIVALLGILIAGLDELHQVLLPGRSPDLQDFLADFVACIVTVTLLWSLRDAILRKLFGAEHVTKMK